MAWGRTLFVLGLVWLLVRWIGVGSLAIPDARTVALWAAVLLGLLLLWRDGRALFGRYGNAAKAEHPLAILAERLARGEVDLDTYHKVRDELTSHGRNH